jgi:uncharacterized SAM-binding protein YcdF (DUF218 family)
MDILYLPGKLLQEAIYPFNWAILCLLIATYLLLRKKTRSAVRFQVAGLLLLLVPATGYFSEALIAPLESVYPTRKIEEFSEADLIVVLGGTSGAVRGPRLEAEEMNGARLQTAVRLFRAGKGKAIVVSGGSYRVAGEEFRTEAQDMSDILVGLGVPRSAIIMEPNSRNTFENAAFTAKLLRERSENRVLLVTSALHLPRAAALFRRQGVEATAVPCSFLGGSNFGVISGLKPAPLHLQRTESAIKEYVGRLAYWVMGRG